MARGVQRQFRGRGPRRMTEWSSYDGASTAVADTGATLLSGLAFESPGTLIRTRGIFSIAPQTFAADLVIVGAYGIGIVSAEAFAAGVASIPEPASDADWGGWMVIEPFSFRTEFLDSTGVVFPSSFTVNVDSKAMRKVEPNSVAVVVVDSLAGAFNVVDMTRLLLKLH